MKTKLKSLFNASILFSSLLLFTHTASAQIGVRCTPAKSEFLAFEKIKLKVTLTNRSGQPIQFTNTRNARWIEFIVERNGSTPLYAARSLTYKPITLATGRSITSTFTINREFDLSQPGNYSAYTIVRLPGQSSKEGFRSRRVFFNVIKGYVSWSQKAGTPGKAGDTKEYSLINLANKNNSQLYVQIKDVKRQRIINTYSLGRSISFSKFKATIDNESNLHVLFLTTPTLHCHTVVNTAGKTILKEYHKRGFNNSRPKLITTNTGVVGVVDSTLYDPEKERKEKTKIHKLSELPIGL